MLLVFFWYLDPVLVLAHRPQMVVDIVMDVQSISLRLFDQVGVCSRKVSLLNRGSNKRGC